MKHFTLPLSNEDVRGLKTGDIIELSGTIYTARDEAHMRALEHDMEGRALPFDLTGSSIFHCGPIMREKEGVWKLVAAGPTTSSRMNGLEPEVIKRFEVRAIIGKGGMSQPTIDTMKEYGCVYLAITGGAAVLAAKGIKEVKCVHWLDLGMPEAVWVLEANHFGPLTVAIDTNGDSLYKKVEKHVHEMLPHIKKKMGI